MRNFSSFLLLVVGLLLACSVQANPLSPGASLIETNQDPDLAELVHSSHSPIVSPDGKHLYFSRYADQEFASILVFGLAADEINRPFFLRAYKQGVASDDSLAGANLVLRQFNASGSRAYATFGQRETSSNPETPFGIKVFARDSATGDLSEVQSLTMPDGVYVGAPVITADGKHLYVSTYPHDPDASGDVELRRYNLAIDTGLLQDAVSVSIPRADALRFLRLLDNDTRLLGSSNTALVEYRRDTGTGELTLVQTTPLPELSPDNESLNDVHPGPVSIAVPSDGRFVYTLRAELLQSGGGFLNSFSRDTDSGALTLTDQLLPADFPDNGLFRSSQVLLSDLQDRLLVPSSYHRYFAGSPTRFNCINVFALTAERGGLRPTGTHCGDATGDGWAPHPQTNRFYSSVWQLKPFANFPAYGSAIGIWEPGRIVQPTTIYAAVLPTSRTIGERDTNTEPATYFTSVLNPGPEAAVQCTISYAGQVPIDLRFQVNDLITNLPLNADQYDREFDVPAGGVTQLTLTVFSRAAFTTRNIDLDYSCINSADATRVQGVNTLLISASILPLPDMITGVATTQNDGIARLPSVTGTGFFAVSTINIGAEAELRAVPVFDLADLIEVLELVEGATNASLRICETNPSNGECLSTPTAQVARGFANQDIATYTVFVVGNGSDIALDPARNRVFIAFVDEAGEVRGASSVAIMTNPLLTELHAKAM